MNTSNQYSLSGGAAEMYNHNGQVDKAGLNRLIGMMVKGKRLKSKPKGGVDKYILPLAKVGYKGG